MNTAKKLVSLTLAALMLFAGLPVRASEVALHKAPAARYLDQTALKGQVEAAISESRPQNTYGDKVPTEAQIIKKVRAAMKKMEDSPSLEDEIKKLTPQEQKQLEAMKKDFDAKTDKFMAEHAYELKDFPKEKQRVLAGSSVLFSRLSRDERVELSFYLTLGGAEIMLFGMLLAGVLAHFDKIDPDILLKAFAGVEITGAIAMLIGTVAIFLFTGSTDYYPYYSDKAYVPTEHGRTLGNNEQIKKEFLADPLGALGLLGKVTGPHQTNVQAVYYTDIEGATMFSDAADILYYAPRYNMQDARYQAYFKKTLYMQTLYWQQLSKEEKMKYLHEFATELKEETRKAVATGFFGNLTNNIGTEQKVSLKIRP